MSFNPYSDHQLLILADELIRRPVIKQAELEGLAEELALRSASSDSPTLQLELEAAMLRVKAMASNQPMLISSPQGERVQMPISEMVFTPDEMWALLIALDEWVPEVRAEHFKPIRAALIKELEVELDIHRGERGHARDIVDPDN